MRELFAIIMNMTPTIQDQAKKNPTTGLQLCTFKINEDYRNKWNIHQGDFVLLTKNGEIIRETLYRVGGFGGDIKKDYFLLLKHVEAHYSDSITKVDKDKPHLEARWCIIDKHGNEKVEFDEFKHPYLVKDSIIYSIDGKYYNIETGEFYCDTSDHIESKEFLFLENKYDQNHSRRGVMQINKKDGTWVLFP